MSPDGRLSWWNASPVPQRHDVNGPKAAETRGEKRRVVSAGVRAARTGAARAPGPGAGRTARAGAGDQSGPATRTYMISSPPGPGGGAEKGSAPRGSQWGARRRRGFRSPSPPPRAPPSSQLIPGRVPLLARLLRGAADAERAGERAPGAAARAASQSGSAGAHPRGGAPPSPGCRAPAAAAETRRAPRSPAGRGWPPRLPSLAQRGGGGKLACPPLRAGRQPHVPALERGCPRADAGALLPAEAPAEPGQRRRRRAGYKGTHLRGRRGI